MPDEVEMIIFASQKGRLTLSLRNYEDTRITRDIEKRSVNFKLLEKEIPNYNQRREDRRNRRSK
jgi:pilus assembly protein CpaB